MKNNLFAITALVTLISVPAFATIKDDALKFVPGGKIVEEKVEEMKVQTPAGTIVEVEFEGGKFEEASGDAAENDVFVPGNGILSLKEALAALKKAGKSSSGDWSLDNSFLRGWHYEFEGYENGKKMDYIIDAKTGKLIDAKVDD